MRLFSIVTAILVVAALYLMIFDRERVLAIAGRGGEAETTQAAVDESATTPETPSGAVADTLSAVSVVAMRSTAETVDSAVVLRGRTEAARQVDVRAETSGLIVSEPLRKGTFVTAGQLMCEIDPGTRLVALSEAQARLLEAEARLPVAEAGVPEAEARAQEAAARLIEARARVDEALVNENAAKRLKADGFASETRLKAATAALESARAGVDAVEASIKSAQSGIASARSGIETAKSGILSAKAGVAAAEKEIERLRILAPFDGLLESDTAELGALLQPGALCATIIQLDPIKLVGFVPETEMGKVTVGAPAGARLTSGREVRGIVTFLSRSADPNTRTFRVEIEVANADLSISDGQTADILIASDGLTAHLIPQSALTLNDEGALGVRVARDDLARFVPVTILRDTAKGVWVTGLSDSADIIVTGQEFVSDGSAIKVSFREATQ